MSVTTNASAPSLAAPPPSCKRRLSVANGGIADPAQCLQTQLQGVTCSSWETHE
jgi:hypothetical protein